MKRARKNIAGWRAAGAEISEEEKEASTERRRPGWLQNRGGGGISWDDVGWCGKGGAEVVRTQRWVLVSLVKEFPSLASGLLLISCVTLS